MALLIPGPPTFKRHFGPQGFCLPGRTKTRRPDDAFRPIRKPPFPPVDHGMCTLGDSQVTAGGQGKAAQRRAVDVDDWEVFSVM